MDLVLLSGDLLDSLTTYFETGEVLARSLQEIPAPVFIAPGNHDYYSPRSPYARLKLPDNVYVFTENAIRCVELPGLGVRVYGAAFTDKNSPALLAGFNARPEPGVWKLLCLHGEIEAKNVATLRIEEFLESPKGAALSDSIRNCYKSAKYLISAGALDYGVVPCYSEPDEVTVDDQYINNLLKADELKRSSFKNSLERVNEYIAGCDSLE